MSKSVPLSDNDARVLEILQGQGRRSYADLGADLGMAAPSVHERVKKLEARGVIRGYRADVDPAAVGLSVLAFTWVRQAPGTVQTDLMPAFAAIPEIEECHHLAGEADYLLKIRARDMEHLGSIVKVVQANAEVFSTETDVAFTTGFERRALPITTQPAAARPANGSETRRAGSA